MTMFEMSNVSRYPGVVLIFILDSINKSVCAKNLCLKYKRWVQDL